MAGDAKVSFVKWTGLGEARQVQPLRTPNLPKQGAPALSQHQHGQTQSYLATLSFVSRRGLGANTPGWRSLFNTIVGSCPPQMSPLFFPSRWSQKQVAPVYWPSKTEGRLWSHLVLALGLGCGLNFYFNARVLGTTTQTAKTTNMPL